MGWSGGTFTRTNGTYTGASVWNSDETNGFDIESARHDTHDQDLATGINATLTKDGSNSPSTNLSWVHTTIDLGTLSGSSNTYTKTNSPAVSAYATGQVFIVVPNHDNTGASTINLDSLGAKNIKIPCGGAVYDTPEGSLRNGQPAMLRYDGTQFLLLGATIIDRQSAVADVVDVTNVATEQDLYSFSVKADTLGIANKLILTVNMDMKCGGTPNLTIRAKYGSTTAFSYTYTSVPSTGANRHYGRYEFELSGFGTTSAQYSRVKGGFYDDPSTAGAGAVGASNGTVPLEYLACSSTPTEDSTTDLDLKITGHWSSASTSHSVRVVNATLKFE